MARAKNGINGNISGKVGNVVFYERNGISYVRTAPARRIERNSSEIVQMTRIKFKLVQRYVIRMLQFVKFGFQFGAGNGTAYNRAMSYNLRNAVKSHKEEAFIDWNNLAFSRDMPDPIKEISFSLNRASKQLTLRWQLDDEMALRLKGHQMHTYILIIPSDLDSWNVQGLSAGNPMQEMEETLNILSYDTTIVHHIYIAFASIEIPIRSTNSRYVGAIEM